MTSTHSHKTKDFHTVFDVHALGEGDPVAGTNLLATMACAIANVAPPDSGLLGNDDSRQAVGMSLTVSGGHSSSLALEKVIRPLSVRQNNFNAHLLRTIRESEETTGKDYISEEESRKPLLPQATKHGEANPVRGLVSGMRYDWETLLVSAPPLELEDMIDRPLTFIPLSAAGDLRKKLQQSHLGRPCVHLDVADAPDLARFQERCVDVMKGRHFGGGLAGTVRGNVIVTDCTGVLGEVVRDQDERGAWLGQTLWLVGGGAGPEPGSDPPSDGDDRIGDLAGRFEIALSQLWAKRMERRGGPDLSRCEHAGLQARWMAFLATKEREFPGITGAARSLFVSLIYGLAKIVEAQRKPPDLKWAGHVEGLAKFLVHRMVNSRAAWLHTEETHRNLRLQSTILRKLEDRPLQTRELVRKFHAIPTSRCKEALALLEESGAVVRDGVTWRLPFSEDLTVTLEA